MMLVAVSVADSHFGSKHTTGGWPAICALNVGETSFFSMCIIAPLIIEDNEGLVIVARQRSAFIFLYQRSFAPPRTSASYS